MLMWNCTRDNLHGRKQNQRLIPEQLHRYLPGKALLSMFLDD